MDKNSILQYKSTFEALLETSKATMPKSKLRFGLPANYKRYWAMPVGKIFSLPYTGR